MSRVIINITEFWTFRLDERRIQVGVMRISAPIKHYWSEKYSLDFSKLLDSSAYKEEHRLGMLQWSMKHRAENPGYFPVEAIRMADGKSKFYSST